MPDVSVDYEKVLAVAGRLNQVSTDTVPILSTLQTEVGKLLDPAGGLWLVQSSPLLSEKYKAFNTSVTQAVTNIPSWAQQFNNIVSTLTALDEAISKSAQS